jgi:hypothetical protein
MVFEIALAFSRTLMTGLKAKDNFETTAKPALARRDRGDGGYFSLQLTN